MPRVGFNPIVQTGQSLDLEGSEYWSELGTFGGLFPKEQPNLQKQTSQLLSLDRKILSRRLRQTPQTTRMLASSQTNPSLIRPRSRLTSCFCTG